jgi:hypothetical protein
MDYGKYYVVEVDRDQFWRKLDVIGFRRAVHVFESEVKALVGVQMLLLQIGRKFEEWLRKQKVEIGKEIFERGVRYEVPVDISGVYIPLFDHIFDAQEFFDFAKAVSEGRPVESDGTIRRVVNHIFRVNLLTFEVATRRMECKA